MAVTASEARKAYRRKWAKENPDKIRAYQERYWEKKAREMEVEAARGTNAAAVNEATGEH